MRCAMSICDINRGEIFALLGPNGAGKTTLIGIICGIVNPSKGQIAVGGHDIIRDYRAARAMIGLVPQELATDSFETVWATVELQPRPVRQEARSGAPRKGAEGPVAVGQEGLQDHHALGRHEAAGDDRQGAGARAERLVSR